MNEHLSGLGSLKKLFKFVLVKLNKGQIKPDVLEIFFLLLLQIDITNLYPKPSHPSQNQNVPPNLQMMTLALRPCPWIGEIRILRNKNNWILYSSIAVLHACSKYVVDVRHFLCTVQSCLGTRVYICQLSERN